MHLVPALTTSEQGIVLVLISCLAAPIAVFVFARSGEAWRSIGKGPLSIEPEDLRPSRPGAPSPPVDPAVQAAEVRQMLEAKAARQRRRGQRPLDLAAEAARLLEPAAEPPPGERMQAELRAEVRQLVVARNERRRRQGLEPLDVAAETERQLADLVGSPPIS